jgi:hypothetical protein
MTVAVTLFGGLGNQLFQFAAARGVCSDGPVIVDDRLSNIWGNPLEDVLRTGAVRRASARELLRLRQVPTRSLRMLKAIDCMAGTSGERMMQQGYGPPGPRMRPLAMVSCVTGSFLSARRFDDVVPERGPILLRGFFQDEALFAHVANALVEAFALPPVDVPADAVAVSFRRRSDYAGNVLPVSYYRDAISKLGADSWVLCGDTPDDVLAHLLPGRVVSFVGHPPAVQLAALSSCRRQVLANSTFSWWGAWLAEQTLCDAEVLVPEPWFDNDVTQLPARWTRVGRDVPAHKEAAADGRNMRR